MVWYNDLGQVTIIHTPTENPTQHEGKNKLYR